MLSPSDLPIFINQETHRDQQFHLSTPAKLPFHTNQPPSLLIITAITNLASPSTMASPYANFGAYWNVECRVNALWNTILHQLFGPLNNAVGTPVIIPEDYPLPNSTSGRTMDLSVRRLVNPIGAVTPVTVTRPRVVLEGKGANGDSFANIAEQMELWCAEANLEEDFSICIVPSS